MKLCLECQDRVFGREDKKFCGDSCRNSYNNKQNKDSSNLMRNVNNKLRRNYRILSDINTEGKTKITKSKLDGLGFDFNYFTNLKVYKNGSEYKFIYDQGYKILEEDFVLIVKNCKIIFCKFGFFELIFIWINGIIDGILQVRLIQNRSVKNSICHI